jgi:nucleotide-binding universal stress UspA family protein
LRERQPWQEHQEVIQNEVIGSKISFPGELHKNLYGERKNLNRRPADSWEALETSARQQANEAIGMATKPFSGRQGLAISSEILKGSAEATILEEAERWEADLIVIGSHGYTGLKRILLGSVSNAVVAPAPCSVEIARSREADQNAA